MGILGYLPHMPSSKTHSLHILKSARQLFQTLPHTTRTDGRNIADTLLLEEVYEIPTQIRVEQVHALRAQLPTS